MEQPISVKMILDSLGGWEMLQLCLGAKSYDTCEEVDRFSIRYIDGELRIYCKAWEGKIRVYGAFGEGGRNEFVNIILTGGSYNKDFVGVVERVTQLKLDLF